MNLTDWLKAQWLKAHKTSRQEIANLFGVADRDLRDCQVSGLSEDARLAIAYNAALQCAVAALAACGYQPSREAHHVRVILSLEYTIGADNKLVAQFDELIVCGEGELIKAFLLPSQTPTGQELP